MALEYIPWLVCGGVAAAMVAGCTAVCTVKIACTGKNDSSKDQARYIKEDISTQRVEKGIVVTNRKQILKITAANVDSQTMFSNELQHQESETAKNIAAKDIGGLTVAGLVNTASSVVGSAVGSVSNFFNSSKDVNITGGQNVVISGDNIVNAADLTMQNGEYEVNLGQVDYQELDENNLIQNSNTVETVEVDDILPAQEQGNYLNMLEDVQVDDQGVNNQFIDQELVGEESV